MTTARATTAPHPFRPDHVGEPGYRSRCVTCGQERHRQTPRIPAQRSEGPRVPDKPPDAVGGLSGARTGHPGQNVTTNPRTDTAPPVNPTQEQPCS